MSDCVKDCGGIPLPVFTTGTVGYIDEEEGARPSGSVWRLTLMARNVRGADGFARLAEKPLPGQFYLLRAVRSGVLLGRPISVFSASAASALDPLKVDFLILRKGGGTEELTRLRIGDEVEMIGPLGNVFPRPNEGERVAVVGGGIGVAPVAGFASTLPPGSYDFFAAFRSGSYGLGRISPANLEVTTDDGSVGTKGMISAVLTEERVRGYDVVYACGPTPMLAYVQKVCAAAGVRSWISMENRMACGLGACLGCTISTREGNRRCCVDGPVFDGSILRFDPPKVRVLPNSSEEFEPDLSVEIAGVRFRNPVIAASGTFGYGSEYSTVFDVDSLGGICSKGLTLEPREGNGGVRLVETAGGLINSIGLENPGIERFISAQLPMMLSMKPVAIANLSGSSVDGYARGAELLDATDVPMIELNISCPNVKAGGMAFGLDAEAASSVTRAVRAATRKPLMVKLSPNAPYPIEIALAVKDAGADAISLVNTFQATAIDVETGRPVFDNVRAGLCGPAVKPIALRIVYDVVQAMNCLPEAERIPVVGIGGIATWRDAVEFIMAGAAAVEVGTATFANPPAMLGIIDGIRAFMRRKGFRTLSDFRGMAQL